MINSFDELPEEAAQTLKYYYFDKWKSRIEGNDADEAEAITRPLYVYLQRMFFQARYDKMSDSERLMFHYFAETLLEKDAGYKGLIYGGNENLINDDADHDLYADRMFDRLWKLYIEDAGNGLVKKKPSTVISRVLDLFR